MNKAIFLDKDGTLVDNSKYPEVPKNDILPYVIEGLRDLKDMGFLLYIVSNQSYINKGQVTSEEIENDFKKLLQEFEKGGVILDGYFYCPHRADEKCNCRKPHTGLLDNLIKEKDININASWVIGDSINDQELAENLGTRVMIIDNPHTTDLADAESYKFYPIKDMREVRSVVERFA